MPKVLTFRFEAENAKRALKIARDAAEAARRILESCRKSEQEAISNRLSAESGLGHAEAYLKECEEKWTDLLLRMGERASEDSLYALAAALDGEAGG